MLSSNIKQLTAIYNSRSLIRSHQYENQTAGADLYQVKELSLLIRIPTRLFKRNYLVYMHKYLLSIIYKTIVDVKKNNNVPLTWADTRIER